ncbi:uncharacterized protein G2W53_010149 [Senna tora]|uniref:Uncharacterized protein n=1 Tax=Senna tora TaxID=362788 RepID=A0A835CB26_9FABA|nr:uncharacterized protein G2W53_010149 [Senna tora]
MTSKSFNAMTNPIRALNQLGFPNTTRSDRQDFTLLPIGNEFYSSIKSTRIPKYNAKRSREAIGLTHLCNNWFDLYFLNSFEIQSQFSFQNVFRHDFTTLPCDHEWDSSNKPNRVSKYNAKRSV